MRHACGRRRQPLSRAAQIALGAIAYAITFTVAALITIGSALTIWALWQRMGVN